MEDKANYVTLAAEITAAWLSNSHNRVDADAVPAFLTTIHAAVVRLAEAGAGPISEAPSAAPEYTPATTVRKSLASPDRIISMIDGKPYRALRRHLSSNGLTPDEYRARYNLKADYPMVAPAYSEARRAMAKQIGLGRKPKADTKAPEAAAPRKKLKLAKPA